MGDAKIKSWSGADQVDSEANYGARRIYIAVAHGQTFEEAFAVEDRRWRAFAAEQNKRVNNAAKITRGPYSGQSCMMHRWANPDKIAERKTHMRWMVRKAFRADIDNAKKALKDLGVPDDIAGAVEKEGAHVAAPYGIKAIKAAVALRCALRR